MNAQSVSSLSEGHGTAEIPRAESCRPTGLGNCLQNSHICSNTQPHRSKQQREPQTGHPEKSWQTHGKWTGELSRQRKDKSTLKVATEGSLPRRSEDTSEL